MEKLKKVLIGMLVFATMLFGIIGGLEFIKNKEQEKARVETLAEIDAERRSISYGDDSTPDPWIAKRQKKDSLLKNITSKTISKVKVVRDTSSLRRMKKEIDPITKTIPLVEIYFYMRSSSILDGEFSDIRPDELETQIKAFMGLNPYKMKSWGDGMKNGIAKFRTSFSKKEQLTVAKSLELNAVLVDSLNSLSNKDQTRLFQLIERIRQNQTKEYDWIYSTKSEKTLKEEYSLLRKVWVMPPLVKSHPTEWGGWEYGLGQKLNEQVDKDGRVTTNPGYVTWNTRYLNVYQFCINMVYRRILAINPQDDEQRREVISKVARLLHEGAAELEK